MKIKINLIHILSLTLFFSCSNNKKKGTVIDSGVIAIEAGLNFQHHSLADSILIEKIVKLETKEKSTLSKDYAIKRILTEGDKIYILDSKFMSIKVFNSQGKYLFELGSLGNRKAEFTNVQDIAINPENKNLWILCNTPKKIIEFSPDGNFIKEIDMSFFASALGFGEYNEIYFFNNQNPNDVSMNKNLIITDQKVAIVNGLFDLPKKLTSAFSFAGNIYQCGKEVFYNPPFDNTIYKLKDGDAQAAYSISFGKLSTPKDFALDSMNYYMLNKASLSMFFVKNDNFIGVKYFNRGLPANLFYNIKSKSVLQTDTSMNNLNFLFTNSIFQNDKDFIMLINYDIIGEFVKKNKETIQKSFPIIYNQMITHKPHDNPYLLYFKIK